MPKDLKRFYLLLKLKSVVLFYDEVGMSGVTVVVIFLGMSGVTVVVLVFLLVGNAGESGLGVNIIVLVLL